MEAQDATKRLARDQVPLEDPLASPRPIASGQASDTFRMVALGATVVAAVAAVTIAVGRFNESTPRGTGSSSEQTRALEPSTKDAAVGSPHSRTRRVVVDTKPTGLVLYDAKTEQPLGPGPLTIHLDIGENFSVFAKHGELRSEPRELGGPSHEARIEIDLSSQAIEGTAHGP